MKNLVIAMLFLPVILRAWDTDIHIMTKADTMTSSYDLVVPSDSEVFFTTRNVLNDTAYMFTYYTTNYGETWEFLQGSAGYAIGQNKDLPIYVDYFSDTLYILFPFSPDIFFPFLVKDMYSSTQWINRGGSFYTLDSVKSSCMTMAKRPDTPYIYVAAMGWKGTATYYAIVRSTNLGQTWDTIKTRYISSSQVIRNLKDFRSFSYGDSVKLLLAYAYDDTANDVHSIYYSVYMDNFADTFTTVAEFKFTNRSTAGAVTASVLSGIQTIAYVDNNKLYFIYSWDNWTTSSQVEYPYNGDYDQIISLDIVPWTTFLSSGFNLTYTAYSGGIQRVYYDEIKVLGDTLSFGIPVAVSDTNVYTYLFNFSPYYHPRIANMYDVNTPSIVWHNDFSHYSNPVFFFDSTQFYYDAMQSNQVKEQNSRSALTVSGISALYKNNTLSLTAGNINGAKTVDIIDITGRKVLSDKVIFKAGKGTLNTGSLRNGIYFVTLKNEGRILKGKFMKLR